jgi:hypothetical protein
MSLAWRILLLALLLNGLTVASCRASCTSGSSVGSTTSATIVRQSVDSSFAELERVYSPAALRDAAADAAVVRRLLAAATPRDLYDDVIVTSGRPPYEGVFLNPRGAVHRDPDQFPQELIAAGMVQAREVDGGLLPVADGYCRALRQAGDVVGYLWFRAAGEGAAADVAATVDVGARRAGVDAAVRCGAVHGDRAHRAAPAAGARRCGGVARQRALRRAYPAARAACPNSIRC